MISAVLWLVLIVAGVAVYATKAGAYACLCVVAVALCVVVVDLTDSDHFVNGGPHDD